MMEFFIGLCIAVFISIGIRVTAYLFEKDKQQKEEFEKQKELPEKRCPQHKWRYDHNERLYCEWCKNVPGYTGRDGG